MDEELGEQLLFKASHGQLMDWLTSSELAHDDRDCAIKCLAHLHSVRRIDVFEHIVRPPGQDGWPIDLGAWSRIYQDLIPLLDDAAGRVVSAVGLLSEGLLGPFVQEAFLGWCKQDLRRVEEVLALEPLPETPEFCLVAALIVGLQTDAVGYLDIAIAYAQGSYRSRGPGIRGIAMMSVEVEEPVKRAVSALEDVHNDANVPIRDRVDALTAAVELAQRCGGYLDDAVSTMVEKAAESGQAELLRTCCNFIVRFGAKIRGSLLLPLLKALQSQDIDASEPRSVTDSALYSLLTHERQEEALTSLEVLLRKSQASDPLDALRSTAHHLSHGNGSLLPIVICRWLLTSEAALCAAARNLLILTGNQRYVFDFDPGNQNWPDNLTLYLARKAIGWLMPHGTAPASFIVCLVRGANEQAGKELGNLLFDPLLVNYPGPTRSYLEEVCPSLPELAKAAVVAVLTRDDSYKQAINEVGFVPELQPTERQRRIEHERQAEEFDKARKWAEGKSVLANLFSRRTMLFGKRAISYVDDFNGETRRLDNRLGTHRYEAPNAMGWVYDPFGLDYTLRIFRAEPKPQ